MCVPITAFDLPTSLQGDLVQCFGNRKPATALCLRRHGNESSLCFDDLIVVVMLNAAMLQNLMHLVATV